ncbi:PAS domain S-box protein (plasmid) [Sulfitobacter sp. W027]|uniref:PAS domain-containing sensor histidine kinase n=1 Tax=Sulfitobacter sp. W027 TaxID=2867025 RepID=UPI0021A94F15|nr:PAS domain S-box protein [Sulfitobacter sp. W027]UWR35616.1 PAS domain S-box protein [Sulfitobacter sp. W027]
MFQSIIENSPFGVWVVDERGSVVFRNKSAENLLPSDVVDGIGSHISELLPALSVIEGNLCIKSLGIGELENIIALPKGEESRRFCEVILSKFEDAEGRKYNIVNLNEVTSRVQAWQALRDQEERWNLALEGSQIGVFESDLRTGTGVASDAWFQLLGICESDGRNSDDEWRARIHPDDRTTVEALDAECIEGRIEKSEAKFRMRVGDDSWRWMRSILRVTERDDEGRAVRLLGTMIDITPLESALELAKARKVGLEMLLANAPVAMAVLALDGTFLLLNDSCYSLFGYPRGQLEQKKFWKLSNTETLKNVRDEVERLLASEIKASRIEQRYTKPGGEVIDIAIRLSVVQRPVRTETRLIIQMVDITEKKRLEALKDDFVATVSHELRTPLASIHGALRLLTGAIGDGASEQVKKLLDLAGRNSVRLGEVVKDLLDFQKLTAGHFAVEMARVEVVELVEQTILDNEPFSEKFQVSVVLDGANPPVYINADAQRLKQVITNLLSNASKFSTAGGTVDVCIEVSGSSCKVSVSNDGPGISQEFGTRIFQPFSQQADHLTRSREGTGLGLAISKELVESMGGDIGYESTPNIRTTFWVRLPIFNE